MLRVQLDSQPDTDVCLLLQHEKGDTELFSVYVPTNHVYVGDIFLLGKADIIKTNLSVREGLGTPLSAMLLYEHGWSLSTGCAAEIVVSVGMGLPRTLKALRSPND